MIKVGVAEFRQHEYRMVRDFCPDGQNLQDTWEEHKTEVEKTLERFRLQGITAVPVVLSLATLMKFEADNGFGPDAGKRARMASERVMA
ncbi:MAG: hypothetical protein AB8H12_19900 [Lewinella sp.]